jgi:hypothetical protein
MPSRAQMETWAQQAYKLAAQGRQIPERKLQAALQLASEASAATGSIAPFQSYLQKVAAYIPVAEQAQLKITAGRLVPGQEVLTSGYLPPDVTHVYSLVGIGNYDPDAGVYEGGVRTVRTNVTPGMSAFDVLSNVQEVIDIWGEQHYELGATVAVPVWDPEGALGFVPSIV